jgi:ATP12 chaperone protein
MDPSAWILHTTTHYKVADKPRPTLTMVRPTTMIRNLLSSITINTRRRPPRPTQQQQQQIQPVTAGGFAAVAALERRQQVSLFHSSSTTSSTRSTRKSSSGGSSSSSGSGSKVGGGATRLTGRPRFYKEVDVTVVNPPWFEYLIKNSRGGGGKNEERATTDNCTNDSNSQNSNDDVIESPISAGVDGTQSATGVMHIPTNPTTTTTNNDENENKDVKNSGVLDRAARLELMLTPRSSSKNDTNWYGVTLDGRKLSTPMGQILAVPSKQLAYMIAAEWDAQTTRLQPTNMPFMTLTCTTLDQAAFNPDAYQNEALKFLPTDTVRISF